MRWQGCGKVVRLATGSDVSADSANQSNFSGGLEMFADKPEQR